MSATPSLKSRIAFWAVCGLLVYAIALGWTYATQERQIYFPPPASKVPYDIRIDRGDVVLGGWISSGKEPGAIVLFGGNAMTMSNWRRRQGLSGCTDRTWVLVPYRSYEGNPGQPREQLLVDDGLAVVAWARKQYGPVSAFGISLGSGVATAVAADPHSGVDRLLLGTPYDSLANVGQDLMPWLLPRLLMKDAYDSRARAPAVKVPVWVLRADADEIVRAPRTAALLSAFAPHQARETVVSGRHDTGWATDQACQWLRAATHGS